VTSTSVSDQAAAGSEITVTYGSGGGKR
jgi:hypothetical protein